MALSALPSLYKLALPTAPPNVLFRDAFEFLDRTGDSVLIHDWLSLRIAKTRDGA
jgi:hypothetical protein